MKMDRKSKAVRNPAKLKTDNSKNDGNDIGKKPNRSVARTKTAKGQLPRFDEETRQMPEESIGSPQRLLATYEHAPIGIIENSLEGNYVNCNEEFCRITGYGKEELLSLGIKDLTYEEDYVFDIKLHQRLIAGEIPFYKLEKRYLRKDGELIWAEVTRSLVRDADGEPLYTIGAVLDVSERKQAEEQLRRTASFNKAVMSNMGEGLYTVDSKGLVTSMNSAAEKLFGWTFDELRGRKMHDVTHYKHSDGTPFSAEDCAGFQVLHSGQILVNFEDVFIRKDGTFFDVLYSSSPLWENGNINGLVVMFSDITERKRAEQVLTEFARQQEALYKLADQLHRTNSLEDVFNAALDAILNALQCDRASILLYDNTGVMRFVAWRGLSDDYREAAEGHSPWTPDEKNPEPVGINNIGTAELSDSLKAVINREGIGSLAFIPLVSNGKLIGKFMVYFNAPHVFREGELELSLTIARQLAFGIDRRRSEEALLASESLYRVIARSIPGGGVYVLDKDFRYLVADGLVTEAFGLSREMLEGHTVSEVFNGDAGERMKGRLQQNFAGETISYETKHNGRVYWTQQAPLLDSIGHAIVVTIDITNQKRAEEALRESEERYRNLFDLVPVAVYACDANGLIQEFNHRAVELWGREPHKNDPKEKFCGSFKIFYPDGRLMPHAACPMARMLGGESLEPHELEILVERPDGLRRNVLAHPLALKNERGEIIGAINCLYDITERKRAEEKIIFQANLLGAVGSAVIATDLNGIVLYWNPAAEKLYGWSSSDALGKNVREVAPAPQSQEQAGEIMKQLASGKSWSGDFLVQRRDGSTFPAFVSDSPILDSSGKLVGIIGVSSDITALKQAEEALRESEERFRAIIRQATAGIVRKDVDGRLLFVNQAFCEMLGYSEAELIGKTIWELTHEEDIGKNKQLYDRMAAEGSPFKLEKRLIRRDSSIIWVDVSVSPIMDAANRLQSAVAVEVEITGRKQAEQALQELNLQLENRVQSRTEKLNNAIEALREEISERKQAEELLRRWAHIFEHADWGIATIRQDTFTMVNPTYASMHGYTAEELVGRSIFDVFDPESHADLREQIRIAYENGHHIYESKHIRRDGSIFPVLVDTTVVRDEAGNVLYRAVNVQDITERKRVEQELHESREHLQILSMRLVEVQEEERRAIARELHDRVGQTLAALNINLIIMSGQLLEDSKQRIGSRLDDSMHLVAEAIALVRNVMTDLRPAVLDDYGLEAALQSYIDEYKSRYNIKVVLDPPDQPIPRLGPSIEMTLLRIGQEALTNIARHAQAGQVSLSLRLVDHSIRLTVQDDGIGIESMQGLKRPNSHGLKIMRERAEAFGGSVNIESAPGKGTKVEARIPIGNDGQNKIQEERR